MKIAIHQRDNTYSSLEDSFNRRWIAYCNANNIPYKLVDAYASDIMEQVKDCDAFMWHFYQNSPRDFLFSLELIQAIAASGKLTFPSVGMSWHFDDKVAQKYLLEGINAPFAETNIFYYKEDALKWLETADVPVVFKLRGGSASQNVKLLRSKSEVKKHINKAFGKGFSQYDAIGILKDRIQKFTKGKDSFVGVLHGMARLGYPTKYAKVRGNEKGYIYFQKFIPNNDSDTRVIVIGEKAFAVKRMAREGEFRASGSGVKKYDKTEIDERAIRISFDISEKLHFECTAYDYVFDENNNPILVEISYGFAIEFYDPCPGYWDEKLNWHEGHFIPQEWMIEDVVRNLRTKII